MNLNKKENGLDQESDDNNPSQSKEVIVKPNSRLFASRLIPSTGDIPQYTRYSMVL